MSDPDDLRLDVERDDQLLVLTMLRDTKRNAIDRKMADAIDAALCELDGIRGSDDSREGVRSFLEKRAPQWKAR